MDQIMWFKCEDCGDEFSYIREGLHSRPRKRCPECRLQKARASGRERQRALRERRKREKDTANKQPNDRPPRLARDGSRGSVSRALLDPTTHGMFANLPNPGRTDKRKAMGLE